MFCQIDAKPGGEFLGLFTGLTCQFLKLDPGGVHHLFGVWRDAGQSDCIGGVDINRLRFDQIIADIRAIFDLVTVH